MGARAEAEQGWSCPMFITLGPRGTCHENALLHYLDFQGIDDFELVLSKTCSGRSSRSATGHTRSSCSAARMCKFTS